MRAAVDVGMSRTLAAKLAVLIVLSAAIGVSLLSYRQRRLAAAHQLAVLHARAEEDARTVLRLRQEIAQRLALPRIRAIAADEGVVEPMLELDFASGRQAPERRVSF